MHLNRFSIFPETSRALKEPWYDLIFHQTDFKVRSHIHCLWVYSTPSFLPVEDAYKIRIRIDDEPANLDILDTAGQVPNPRML